MWAGPLGLRLRRLSRRSCAETLRTLRSAIDSCERTRERAHKRRRVCSLLQIAALIMILPLTLSVSGCCAAPPQVTEAPTLPAGKPKQETTERIALDVSRHAGVSTQDVTIPRELLVRIFGHLDAWRAWGLALEHAGRWAPR